MTTAPLRLYLVEDDPLIALDIRESLIDVGYEILGHTDNGTTAIQEILEKKPDLVILDISLKGDLDGVDVALSIGKTESIPVVFLTGCTDEAMLQRAKLTLPYAYLIKPFDLVELRSSIELAFHRHASETENTYHPDEREIEFESIATDADGKKAILDMFDFFRHLSAAEQDILIQQTSVRSLDADTSLFDEGEKTGGGFIVLSGKIRLMKSSSTGKELVVALLGSGDITGLLFALQEIAGSASARTQVASKMLWIPQHILSSLLEKSAPFSKAILHELSGRLALAFELASSLAHSRVEDRIVHTLVSLAPKIGQGKEKTADGVRLFLTRKDLADLTGTTPETAIRVTKNLEREGYLDLTKPGIIKITNFSGLHTMAA